LRRWLDETAAIYAEIAEKMAPPAAVKRSSAMIDALDSSASEQLRE